MTCIAYATVPTSAGQGGGLFSGKRDKPSGDAWRKLALYNEEIATPVLTKEDEALWRYQLLCRPMAEQFGHATAQLCLALLWGVP